MQPTRLFGVASLLLLGVAIHTGCNRKADAPVANATTEETKRPGGAIQATTSKTDAAAEKSAPEQPSAPGDEKKPADAASQTPASAEKGADPAKPANAAKNPKAPTEKPGEGGADTPAASPAKPSAAPMPAIPMPANPAPVDPAGEAQPKAPADPAFAARKDLDVDGQMRLIVDLVNRPRAVRKTTGFLDHFTTIADALLSSPEASAGYKSTALLAKFKMLHEAAVDGNQEAEARLGKLADEQRDNKGKRVAAYVRLVDTERKLAASRAADPAATAKALDELKSYLAEEEVITNRNLRMATLAAELIDRLPEEQREAWYRKLGEEFAKSVDLDLAYVGRRFGKPAVPASALLGKPFNLTGKLISGEALKWENYRGKLTLVDFWATWCPICVEQHPQMKSLYDKYAGRGLEFIGVSIDTEKEELQKYLRENEISWITLFGKEPQEVAEKYGVRGIPAIFLIDPDGKILMKSNNIAEMEATIKAHVEALEKKNKTAP